MSRSGGDSRRYPTAELYEERQRDFHRGPRRSTREYEELEIDINESRGEPAFLREDYGRSSTAGQLVVRERTRDRSPDRAPVSRPREVEREEIIIREDRERTRPRPQRPRSVEREDITVRRGERDRPRRGTVKEDELDISIRHEHDEEPRRRPRPREVEREEIQIRRSEADLRRVNRGPDDFPVRRGPPPRTEVDQEEITIRHDHDERGGRGRGATSDREEITIRHRSKSRGPRENLPPPRDLVARETEEFVIRRRKPRTPSPSPSPPPPPRRFDREEIIIRRTEERSPSPPPPPPPEPEPEPPVMLQPIIRPPIHQQIHQEIITHHRHIDHGVERARSPSPLPPPPRTPTPPPEPKTDTLEIDIRRTRNGRGDTEEDITIEHEHSRGRERGLEMTRGRSLSTPRRRPYDDELEEEADYYNRKAMERAYVGEAHNGATKDWAIVDVPPGTERVKMDGAGGSSQEISWQRYNGVRRSKFIAGNREFDSGFGLPDHQHQPLPAPAPAPAPALPPARVRSDMWTEVTKDLVIKDAIEAMGYEYEETEFFYYVMEYLRYEDVLQLVEISDEIRRDRRRRIREIEWEREDLRQRNRHYDDRGYEHEVIIDRRRVERDEWSSRMR